MINVLERLTDLGETLPYSHQFIQPHDEGDRQVKRYMGRGFRDYVWFKYTYVGAKLSRGRVVMVIFWVKLAEPWCPHIWSNTGLDFTGKVFFWMRLTSKSVDLE